MAKQRIFISFDYDNDEDIKIMLAGQAKLPDSPFDFTDASVKEHLTGDWRAKVKRRLGNCDQMIVLCGQHTDAAKGVSDELEIAQELDMPYFHLKGRANKGCSMPAAALSSDKLYTWSWDNLKVLIDGGR